MPSSVGDDVDCDFFLSQNTVAHILGLDAGRGAREGRGRQNHNANFRRDTHFKVFFADNPIANDPSELHVKSK